MSFFSFLFDIYPKFITSLPCTSTKQFGLPFSIWSTTTWKRNMAIVFYYIYLPYTILQFSNSDELSGFIVIFLNICIFLKCKVIYLVYFFHTYALLEFTYSALQSTILLSVGSNVLLITMYYWDDQNHIHKVSAILPMFPFSELNQLYYR